MANIDLQQYDGTASFPTTADVGTAADPMLLPTDGPIVTADSNLTDEAPVNVALKRFKDIVMGLRDALVGDRAVAARKTVHTLQADGLGGQPLTAPTGQVVAESDVRSLNGSVRAENGNVFADVWVQAGSAVAPRTRQQGFGLEWIATVIGPGGANPPKGTDLPNKLTARNTLKYWMRIEFAAGAFTLQDGTGNWAVGILSSGGAKRFRFSLLGTPFDDTNYSVVCQPVITSPAAVKYQPFHITDTIANNQFDIGLWDGGSWADLNVVTGGLSIHVHGQQTT